MKKRYKFEIDCANCAAKVEEAIREDRWREWGDGELYDPKADAGRRRCPV